MKHILCRYVTGTAGRGRSCRVANLLWWAPNGALLAILRESKSNMKKYGEKNSDKIETFGPKDRNLPLQPGNLHPSLPEN